MGFGSKTSLGTNSFVSPSTVAITSPLQVANCALWLDASDATKINAGSPANNDPVSTWADKSGNGYNATQNGVLQVETATVAETVEGTLTAGNATVIVTAAGMTGTPKTVSVAVATNDSSATVAGKIRTALAADSNVGAFFTVSGATTKVILTAVTVAANDATMNIDIADGTCVGLTAAHTSANTRAGRTASSVRPTYKTSIQNSLAVVRFSNTSFVQHLVLTGSGLGLVKNLAGISVFAATKTLTGATNTDGALLEASDATIASATTERLAFRRYLGVSYLGTVEIYGSNAEPGDGAFFADTSMIAGFQVGAGVIDFVRPGAIGQSVSGSLTSATAGTTGNTPNTNSLIITIGALATQAVGLDGDIGELIVYQRVLSRLEQRLVIEYLANKWGTL